MKTEDLKHLISTRSHQRTAYQSSLQRIESLFQDIRAGSSGVSWVNLSKLESELHTAKDHKDLKCKDKQPIFKCRFLFIQSLSNATSSSSPSSKKTTVSN